MEDLKLLDTKRFKPPEQLLWLYHQCRFSTSAFGHAESKHIASICFSIIELSRAVCAITLLWSRAKLSRKTWWKDIVFKKSVCSVVLLKLLTESLKFLSSRLYFHTSAMFYCYCHRFKTHLQAGSPGVEEMQILVALGRHTKSNCVEPSWQMLWKKHVIGLSLLRLKDGLPCKLGQSFKDHVSFFSLPNCCTSHISVSLCKSSRVSESLQKKPDQRLGAQSWIIYQCQVSCCETGPKTKRDFPQRESQSVTLSEVNILCFQPQTEPGWHTIIHKPWCS